MHPIPDGSEFNNNFINSSPEHNNDNLSPAAEFGDKEDNGTKRPDELIRAGVATGEWNGNLDHIDRLRNFFVTKTATGDLYQRYDDSGNPVGKYVKFDDGTEYEYNINNKDLIKKMYSKENTVPAFDPVDAAGVVGFGITKPLNKPIEKIFTSLPKAIQSPVTREMIDSAAKTPVSGLETYLKKYR